MYAFSSKTAYTQTTFFVTIVAQLSHKIKLRKNAECTTANSSRNNYQNGTNKILGIKICHSVKLKKFNFIPRVTLNEIVVQALFTLKLRPKVLRNRNNAKCQAWTLRISLMRIKMRKLPTATLFRSPR